MRHYSLLAGSAPNEAGFKTESIRSLFRNGHAVPRTLVIGGGGDILRTDWDLLARHYGFFANRFRARWMDYPAAGPFLLHPKTLPQHSTVAYVSCGVPHEFPGGQLDQVRETLEHASFIALRDEQSAAKLVAAGVNRELRIAPDLTVTLSDQFDHSVLAGRGRRAWLGPHVDLEDKIVTHVLYFNESWNEKDGGCLTILGSGDMAHVVKTIPPVIGNSAVLVRPKNSWHPVTRVVDTCRISRRSVAITFYRPGSPSTMWPAGDTTPLYNYRGEHSALTRQMRDWWCRVTS